MLIPGAERKSYGFDTMMVGDTKIVFEEGYNDMNRAVGAARAFGRYNKRKFKTETDVTGLCVHITRIE